MMRGRPLYFYLRMCALLLLGGGMVPLSAWAERYEIRQWTDGQGRKLDAALVVEHADAVELKPPFGDAVTIPKGALSADDLEWLAGAGSGESAEPSGQDSTPTKIAEHELPDALDDWPRVVALPEMPQVTVIEEDRETGRFVYESERFRFVSDSELSTNVVREFSRLFEVTWLANCLFPLDIKPQPEPGNQKYVARIFDTRAGFESAGGIPESAGTYSPRDKMMMMPLESLGVRKAGNRVTLVPSARDYSTLVHETTHQVMNRWLSRLPIWLVEGSAQYLELAEYQTGRLSFVRRDANLREQLRLAAGRGSFSMLPLETLLSMDGATWNAAFGGDTGTWRNYASALALTYFFYHMDTGNSDIIAYFRAVGNQQGHGVDAALVEEHLLRGRTPAELERDVQRAMRRLNIPVEFPR